VREILRFSFPEHSSHGPGARRALTSALVEAGFVLEIEAIEAVDEERIAIGERLGLEIVPDPVLGCRQGYMSEATYDAGYSRGPGFAGIEAQSTLDHRYFNEDVGFGLVFMESLADQVGVEVPTLSAIVRLASVLMGRDYLADAPRTMASLGFAGLSADEIMARVT